MAPADWREVGEPRARDRLALTVQGVQGSAEMRGVPQRDGGSDQGEHRLSMNDVLTVPVQRDETFVDGPGDERRERRPSACSTEGVEYQLRRRFALPCPSAQWRTVAVSRMPSMRSSLLSIAPATAQPKRISNRQESDREGVPLRASSLGDLKSSRHGGLRR